MSRKKCAKRKKRTAKTTTKPAVASDQQSTSDIRAEPILPKASGPAESLRGGTSGSRTGAKLRADEKKPTGQAKIFTELPTEVLEKILEPDYYGLSAHLALKRVSRSFRETITGMQSRTTLWYTFGDRQGNRGTPRAAQEHRMLEFKGASADSAFTAEVSGRISISTLEPLLKMWCKVDSSVAMPWRLEGPKNKACAQFFALFPWHSAKEVDVIFKAYTRDKAVRKYIVEGLHLAGNLKQLRLANYSADFIDKEMVEAFGESLQGILLISPNILPPVALFDLSYCHLYELLRHVKEILLSIFYTGGKTEKELSSLLLLASDSVEVLKITIMEYEGMEYLPEDYTDGTPIQMTALKSLWVKIPSSVDDRVLPFNVQIDAPAIEELELNPRGTVWLRRSKSLFPQTTKLAMDLTPQFSTFDERMLPVLTQCHKLLTLDIDMSTIIVDENKPALTTVKAIFDMLATNHLVPVKSISLKENPLWDGNDLIALIEARKRMARQHLIDHPIRQLRIPEHLLPSRQVDTLRASVRDTDMSNPSHQRDVLRTLLRDEERREWIQSLMFAFSDLGLLRHLQQ